MKGGNNLQIVARRNDDMRQRADQPSFHRKQERLLIDGAVVTTRSHRKIRNGFFVLQITTVRVGETSRRFGKARGIDDVEATNAADLAELVANRIEVHATRQRAGPNDQVQRNSVPNKETPKNRLRMVERRKIGHDPCRQIVVRDVDAGRHLAPGLEIAFCRHPARQKHHKRHREPRTHEVSGKERALTQ